MVAAEVVKLLSDKSNIAFYGNLGSGKTTLIKEICVQMGGDDTEVRSPTFTIINNYNWNGADIVHIDFYRLDGDEALFLGIDDYFHSNNVLVFMEWPEKAEEILPNDCIRVYLEYVDPITRNIEIK